ncbi:small GTP-binding protein [Tritrichomonas foetus]|uniref:Small GTP-binding protein n=1 Tax=Tritrichomonas foetus TaxID=1144522 RepID=A0A1J4J2Y7_9EUKA|nr:small GTP-binding protein [Tritrichomonas foetus]|eukprot:OHS93714.1 small GTP-binding protein [Tritrichomonas foetus]
MSSLDLKIVVLGVAGVGKTSIINRYCNMTFMTETLSTIGAGFFTHTLTVEGIEVTMMLWDTAGEERFQSVAPSLLRGSNAVILVYDVTNLQSFRGIDIYMDMFLDTCSYENASSLPVLLLGNKSDCENHEVPEQTIEEWKARNRVTMSYEVSAKSGENINQAFEELLKRLVKPAENDNGQAPMQIMLKPEEKSNKNGCC